jgi:hypothetical protein
MERSIVRKENKFCPFCEKEHTVLFVRVTETDKEKRREKKYKKEYFYCPISEKNFGKKEN